MRTSSRFIPLVALVAFFALAAGGARSAPRGMPAASKVHLTDVRKAMADTGWHMGPAVTGGAIKCENGKVKVLDCQNVDLLSFLPLDAMGGHSRLFEGEREPNDVWGWLDSTTGREYAVVGRSDGTSFVDVTDPVNPTYLGDLPLPTGAQPSHYRGVKVYKNHAFIVADAAGPHGLQIFDLTQLRDLKNPPTTFKETVHYGRTNSAHNIAINEETGYAYSVGNSMGGETCGGGLHMIDVRDPTKPAFVGCYADTSVGRQRTGYVHDAQCVIYRGPDQQYQGREVCLNSAETALAIVDVTDKKQPKAISVTGYPNVGYTHQGWLTEDERYFFVDDELDEFNASQSSGEPEKARTIVFDVSDLDDPIVVKEFLSTTPSIDHNLFILGRYMYQSNFNAGLRVIDIIDPKNPKEVGYFDTVPDGMQEEWGGQPGSWGNYPYFKSGAIAVTSSWEGLFMVRFRPPATTP